MGTEHYPLYRLLEDGSIEQVECERCQAADALAEAVRYVIDVIDHKGTLDVDRIEAALTAFEPTPASTGKESDG